MDVNGRLGNENSMNEYNRPFDPSLFLQIHLNTL